MHTMVTFCSLLLWQPLARDAPARSVEDPSARVVRLVKAKGHAPSPLFRIAPDEPDRCQTGLYMSLTPHCLRELRPGVPALGVFVKDLVACYRESQCESRANMPSASALATMMFDDDSLAAILLRGGDEESWGFAALHRPGVKRDVLSMLFRRLYSAIMDSGVACTDRHPAPLRSVLTRSLGAAAAATLVGCRPKL
jgi:hypothetical protein